MPCAKASKVGTIKVGVPQAKEEEKVVNVVKETSLTATAITAESMVIVFENVTRKQLTWGKVRVEANPAERKEARATKKEKARDYILSRSGNAKEEKGMMTIKNGPETNGKRVLRRRGHWRV